MRILMVSTEFDSKKLGGAEKIVFHLSKNLKARDHDISIVSTIKNINSRTINYIIIPRPMDLSSNMGHSSKSVLSLLNPYWIIKFLITLKSFDIIHFHNTHSYAVTFYAIIAGKLLGKKLVWTPHDYWFICPKEDLMLNSDEVCNSPLCFSSCRSKTFPKKLTAFRYSSTKILKFVDCVISPSKFMSKKVVDFGMDGKKIFTVFNGVPPSPDIVHNKGNLRLLFVGHLDKRKGTFVLLKAIDLVKKEFPDVKLHMIGMGPELKSLKKQVKLNKLGDSVIFEGRVTDREMEKIYKKIQILLVPSIWPEVFGLVAVEGMIRGKPVIASDIGGLKDIVVNGKSGYLIEPGNEKELANNIIHLMKNKELQNKFGEFGRKRANKKYTIINYAKNIDKIYKSL